MSELPSPPRTLKELEEEVLAEGREWMRQRLQERLQQAAARDGRVFPPQRPQGPASPHRTTDPADGRRGG